MRSPLDQQDTLGGLLCSYLESDVMCGSTWQQQVGGQLALWYPH